MGNFRELIGYQKAYALALDIHRITTSFPKEEKYGITDQVRRSSRSVCSNLAEAYRRRRYPNHFVSKLHDCDAENAETEVWLDFAKDLNYLSNEAWIDLRNRNAEVGKLINYMINHPDKFI